MASMETAAAESVIQPGSKAGKPAGNAIQASAKTSPLRVLTSGTPTNWNMLTFRTLNREMGQPNANEDNLAPLLRDKLMPLRMWWLKRMPGAMKAFKRGLEHPKHGVPGVLNFVDARTSWFDRVVREAISSHNISQVVVVAAGFDTRAYRIGAKFKGVTFFEVDLPHASEKKQQLVHDLLQPEATFPRPTYLAADLAAHSLDSVLLGLDTPSGSNGGYGGSNGGYGGSNGGYSGSNGGSSSRFDPSKPTLFTVEGLIYYLPEEAVRGLFGAMLRVAAPGSRMAFDFLHKEVLDGSVPCPPAYKVTAVSVANKGEPFVSGMPNSREAVQAFLDSVQPTNTTTSTTTGPINRAADGAATAAELYLNSVKPPTINSTTTTSPPSPISSAADAVATAARQIGQHAPDAVATAGEAGAGTGAGTGSTTTTTGPINPISPAPAADAAATAGEAVADAGAGTGARSGTGLAWRVTDFMGPREAVSRQLPHLQWEDAVPPILSFYSFASAEVVPQQ